jgi:hypothetical protein
MPHWKPCSDTFSFQHTKTTSEYQRGLNRFFQNVGFAARNSLHRRRCASAILALPSVVLGPVDSPPWNRQRRFPGITRMMQWPPARVLAQHLGRNLRFKGGPLCDRPRSNISRHQCRS